LTEARWTSRPRNTLFGNGASYSAHRRRRWPFTKRYQIHLAFTGFYVPRRPVQEWLKKRRNPGDDLVQRSRHQQEGASRFRRVAGLPESPIRDGEASSQLQASPLGFRAKSSQLRLRLHWHGEDDGHKVDEVPVAGRRCPGGTMPLEYRAGLVRDMGRQAGRPGIHVALHRA
jgi:hypothetical protein